MTEEGWGWTFAPVPVALGLLAALLFAQGFVRLRRRGRTRDAGWDRAALFGLALAAGVLPLVSPLDGIADGYLLSAHMVEHVLIGDVAPALAMLALRGPLVFFLLPPAPLRVVARIAWLRRVLGTLLRPKVAFALWLAATAAWHVPAAYDYTLSHEHVHDLEHATFVLAGTLVWAVLVDPARRGEVTPAGRVLFAWCLFAAGHLATHPILFDNVAHYGPYVAQPRRLLGLSPLSDQHWAGWVMTVEELLSFGTLTAVLLRRIPRPARALSE